MRKNEDRPPVWTGGGFCFSGKARFLWMLVLGYLRAEKRKK